MVLVSRLADVGDDFTSINAPCLRIFGLRNVLSPSATRYALELISIENKHYDARYGMNQEKVRGPATRMCQFRVDDAVTTGPGLSERVAFFLIRPFSRLEILRIHAADWSDVSSTTTRSNFIGFHPLFFFQKAPLEYSNSRVSTPVVADLVPRFFLDLDPQLFLRCDQAPHQLGYAAQACPQRAAR